MPARTPRSMRKRVIKRRIEGDSFPKIKSSLGVGVSTAHDIISEVIEVFPDFEEVRELNLNLKEARLTIDEANEATDLLKRLKALGVSMEDFPGIISFYEQQDQSPEDLISIGQRITALTNQFDGSPGEIISRVEALAKQLESLKRSISEAQKTLSDLQLQIPCFRILINLQDKLSQHGLTIEAMDDFIDQNSKLLELGFTPDVASLFATELVKYGLDNKTAARILADDIFESKTLQNAINDRKKEAHVIDEEVRRNREENERLVKQCLTQQNQFDSDKAAFENEERLQKQVLKQLESEIEDKKAELRELTDKTNDMKEIRNTLTSDLEEIEKTVETNEYLTTITILMAKSPTSLEWKSIRRASVPFFLGFINYLQANNHVPFYSTLVSNAMTIRGLLVEGARSDIRQRI